MRKVLTALLASALVATPLAAELDLQRSSEPVVDESSLSGSSDLFFILGIAAVAAGVILLQEDEEGAPISA